MWLGDGSEDVSFISLASYALLFASRSAELVFSSMGLLANQNCCCFSPDDLNNCKKTNIRKLKKIYIRCLLVA